MAALSACLYQEIMPSLRSQYYIAALPLLARNAVVTAPSPNTISCTTICYWPLINIEARLYSDDLRSGAIQHRYIARLQYWRLPNYRCMRVYVDATFGQLHCGRAVMIRINLSLSLLYKQRQGWPPSARTSKNRCPIRCYGSTFVPVILYTTSFRVMSKFSSTILAWSSVGFVNLACCLAPKHFLQIQLGLY